MPDNPPPDPGPPESASPESFHSSFAATHLKLILLLVGCWLFSLGQSYHSLTFRTPDNVYPYGLPGADENGYLAYAHSLAWDGDLDFTNQYRMVAARQGDDATGRAHLLLASSTDAQGKPGNIFPVGSGLLSTPALWLGRQLDSLLSAITGKPPLSPAASLWVWIHLANQATLGLLGALLTAYLTCRITRNPAGVTLATAAVILAGPPIMYWLWLPGMSHLTGWALNAVALTLWWRTWAPAHADSDSPKPLSGLPMVAMGLFCGLALGLAIASRPYNLPMILIGAEPLLRHWITRRSAAQTDPLHGMKPPWVWAGTTALGTLLGVFPQLWTWHELWGTWTANRAGWQLQLPPPHALQVLFSPRHGLFYWAPLYLAAVPGLYLLFRRGGFQTRAAWLILGVALGWLVMAGSWRIWWLGVAFGMRGAVDLVPLLVLPMAVLVQQLMETRWQRIPLLMAALAIILNLHLSVAFRSGLVWSDGPLQWSMTLRDPELYRDQLRIDFQSWTQWSRAYRHPLTAPPPSQRNIPSQPRPGV